MMETNNFSGVTILPDDNGPELEAQRDIDLTTCGVVEVMIRNSNVQEFVMRKEREITLLRARIAELERPVDDDELLRIKHDEGGS